MSLFDHHYEPRGVKVMLAKATNKCQHCGGGIPRGSKYIMIFLFDSCTHHIGGRPRGLHKRMKLCRMCRDSAYDPKPKDGKVFSNRKGWAEYAVRVRAAIKEMGISRFEMALKHKVVTT